MSNNSDEKKVSHKGHKGHKGHMWMMAICCGLPIAGFLAIAVIGIRMPSLETALILLCPIGMIGMGLAGGLIALGAWVESQTLAILCLSLGAGWLYFTVGAYWSSTSDLSKVHAGSLSGLMNTGANIGGAISPTVTPWIAEQWGWPVSLGVAAAIALIGGILWLKVDPGKGLFREP